MSMDLQKMTLVCPRFKVRNSGEWLLAASYALKWYKPNDDDDVMGLLKI